MENNRNNVYKIIITRKQENQRIKNKQKQRLEIVFNMTIFQAQLTYQYSIQQKMQKNVQNWDSEHKKRKTRKRGEKSVNKINIHMQCKLTKIKINQVSQELRINKWRYQTDHPIFKVYHFSYEDDKKGYAIANIVYEMPGKLASNLVRSVNLPNCLYILKTLLLGCEKLIQQFGYFKLTLKMVGITEDQTCKIWINENIYINQVMYKASSQEETVESIKNIIQKLYIPDEESTKFINQMNRQSYNIVKFIQFIWKFSYENSILVPPFFAKNIQNQSILTDNHKKTRSLLPSPAKLSNKQNKSQQRFSMQSPKPREYRQYRLESTNIKKKQEPICFRERLMSKLNKSSHVSFRKRNSINSIGKPEQQRNNSKSDFIRRKSIEQKESYCSQKQNLTKTTTSKANQSVNPDENIHNQSQISEQNRMKMKNMIKQKLRQNREKKKVVRLQAIATVKSIGQFTESEKKIIQQNKQNNTLEVLNQMCKKIQTSHFHIEVPNQGYQSIQEQEND